MNKNLSFPQIDREFYFGGELGALWSPQRTLFRLWSPLADNAVLNLYKTSRSRAPFSRVNMRFLNGVWECSVNGGLNGVYYTYSVTINGSTRETIDIYARSAGANGLRGMILDPAAANPAGWEKTSPVTLAKPSDAVIYELHVRDFSADGSADFSARGKFSAFCGKNVRNSFGEPVGLDYIASLGVTHIHLLPVFDFASVDENAAEPQYNWGYDPLNYNVPEGSYSSDPHNGFSRVRELKSLIMAAHERGLGVIMDVVYNHTFDVDGSPFSAIFPDYYYRRRKGKLSNGSGCGNEFASERRMARKFICDSLCMWLREYKLDGFRFDLMGLLDIKTLNLCEKKLRAINPCVLLYGEGWTGGASALSESRRAVKSNAARVKGFAMFSDDFRDCVKGSVFSDEHCGYINGGAEYFRGQMKSAMCGGVFHPQLSRSVSECWAESPAQSVNYVECHDNLTFYDKLRVSMKDAPEEQIIAADKLGAALVFLAQGVPFIQAGQEFLRSKDFVHDSYKSPDSVNSIKWDELTKNRAAADYYAGLIAIRKKFPEFRLGTAEEIREKITFRDLNGGAFAEYIENLILIVNPNPEPLVFPLDREYKVCADRDRAGSAELYAVSPPAVTVSPTSILLLVAGE